MPLLLFAENITTRYHRPSVKVIAVLRSRWMFVVLLFVSVATSDQLTNPSPVPSATWSLTELGDLEVRDLKVASK